MACDGRRPPESGLLAAVLSRSSREVPIQQVIGVQAVTRRGQRRVTPILAPVGASCLLDKGTNPRTSGQRPKDRRPLLLLTCTSTTTCSSYASTAVPYLVVASSPSTGWCPTLCRRTAQPPRRVRHRQGFRHLLLRLLVVASSAHRFVLRLFLLFVPSLCSCLGS